MNVTTPTLRPRPRNWSALAALLPIPTACLVWAFWPTFFDLIQAWNGNPQYSHGYLVPVFAVVLLWEVRAVGSTLRRRGRAGGVWRL